jgi:hypothetical protein
MMATYADLDVYNSMFFVGCHGPGDAPTSDLHF